ncbi:glycosyltransferase [Methanosphaera sp. BMS]|uniref:glycosyltransferase n=1 Tax=Methanosphaera sp. BMS TaxID=1789762 RepID=UPI000DC1C9D6|nr:glycosyltransferase [Methanosphaera sp. BMS]AWX32300.1 hypothetical protein AW729_03900 [Methanosphaera sp. BMS]
MKYKIGILGSCVSRDVFRSVHNPYKNFFEVKFSQVRLSLISLMQKPVPYNDFDITVLPDNADNRYRKRNMKNDLTKSLLDELDTDIDIFVIDLYFEALFGVFKFNDIYLTNNTWDYPHGKFYPNIKNKEFINMKNNREEFLSLWKDNCDKFFEYLYEKKPNLKIILNRVRLTDKFFMNDSVIVDNDLTEKAQIYNDFLEELENYIIENHKVDVIDSTENILGDSNHIWGKSPVHYIKPYYVDVFKQLLDKLNCPYIPYDFSIIIPLTNNVNFLDKTLESLINQSVSFEDYAELILVDLQKRTTNVMIEKYLERYPYNIKYLNKSGYTINMARNEGLKSVSGRYVNFMECGDYFSEKTFESMLNFIEEQEREVDVLSIPVHYIEKNGDNNLLKSQFNKNQLINLNKEYILQKDLFSYFIKSGHVKNFDENVISDLGYIANMINNTLDMGIVIDSTYFHNCTLNNQLINHNSFNQDFSLQLLDEIKFFVTEQDDEKSSILIQHLIVYSIKEIIDENTKNNYWWASTDLIEEKIRYILQGIDEKVILRDQLLNNTFKKFLLYLKDGDMYFDYKEDNLLLKTDNRTIDNLKNHKLWIEDIYVNDNHLIIKGFLNSLFGSEHITFDAILNNTTVINSTFYSQSKYSDIYYLSNKWQKINSFILNIPLSSSKSSIKIRSKYSTENSKTIFSFLNIRFKNNYFRGKNNLILDSYDITFNQNTFTVSRIFKFSIVMAVYNTEKYLEESIDSLIQQTINFTENVQLIIVNDGSTDNSEKIINNYKKSYPKNIVYVPLEENHGQAFARNIGLNYVMGRYVNFLDSDDYLSENALEMAYNFFEKHRDEVDLLSIPLVLVERDTRTHHLNYKYDSNKIIDLNKEPNNPQLSASSCFIKSNLFNNLFFSTDVVSAEDSILINKILLKREKYGVLSNCSYYYRKRMDNTSTIDLIHENKSFYLKNLKNYYIYLIEFSMNNNKVPLFIQYVIIYDLQWMTSKTFIPLNDYELKEFWIYLKYILSFIDEDVIMNNFNIKSKINKMFLLYLRNDSMEYKMEENNVLLKSKNSILDNLKQHTLWIKHMDIEGNNLKLECFINTLFDSSYLSIQAIKHYSNKYHDEVTGFDYEDSELQDKKLLNIPWQYIKTVRFDLDLKKVVSIGLNVNYHINKDNGDMNRYNLKKFYPEIKFKDDCLNHFITKYNNQGISITFEKNMFLISKNKNKLYKQKLKIY